MEGLCHGHATAAPRALERATAHEAVPRPARRLERRGCAKPLDRRPRRAHRHVHARHDLVVDGAHRQLGSVGEHGSQRVSGEVEGVHILRLDVLHPSLAEALQRDGRLGEQALRLLHRLPEQLQPHLLLTRDELRAVGRRLHR